MGIIEAIINFIAMVAGWFQPKKPVDPSAIELSADAARSNQVASQETQNAVSDVAAAQAADVAQTGIDRAVAAHGVLNPNAAGSAVILPNDGGERD